MNYLNKNFKLSCMLNLTLNKYIHSHYIILQKDYLLDNNQKKNYNRFIIMGDFIVIEVSKF